MIIKPTGNKLLLREITEEYSPGGIFLPKGVLQSVAMVAEVLETGPGYEEEKTRWSPCLIRKGQKVILNAQAGLRIAREITKSTELIIIREDQIFGILEG